eukprot:141920-Rhodomonas_salina.1
MPIQAGETVTFFFWKFSGRANIVNSTSTGSANGSPPFGLASWSGLPKLELTLTARRFVEAGEECVVEVGAASGITLPPRGLLPNREARILIRTNA